MTQHRSFRLTPHVKATETKAAVEHRSFRLTRDPNAPPLNLGSVRECFVVGVAQQMLLLFVSALLLDGGRVYGRVLVASMAYWIFVIVFSFRRAKQPTEFDLLYLKYGIWPTMFLTSIVASMLGR
jgi:hypothetical protein